MTPTNDAPVTVDDREAAWRFKPSCYDEGDRDDWMRGKYDRLPLIRSYAAHRLAALASAPTVLPYPAGGGNFGKWHMMLLRLINALHRDNGEKTQAIGINAAFEQALEIVGAPRTPPVPTAAGAKPPSPPGYSLADMKRWHHLGHDDDGIPCD